MKKFILLRQAMLAHGLKQKDLAKIAGLGDSSISARLQGRAEFTAGEMLKIGQALGLQPDDYYLYFLSDTAAFLEGQALLRTTQSCPRCCNPATFGLCGASLAQQTQSTPSRPSTHNGARILPTRPPGQISLQRRRL